MKTKLVGLTAILLMFNSVFNSSDAETFGDKIINSLPIPARKVDLRQWNKDSDQIVHIMQDKILTNWSKYEYISQQDNELSIKEFNEFRYLIHDSSISRDFISEISPNISGTKKENSTESFDFDNKIEMQKELNLLEKTVNNYLGKTFRVKKINRNVGNEKLNYTIDYKGKYFGKVIYSSFVKKIKKKWRYFTDLVFSMKGTSYDRENNSPIPYEFEWSFGFAFKLVILVKVKEI